MQTPKPLSRGRSFKLVGGVFFALIALGLAGAAFVYVTMIRYERVAALHLPPAATSAVRVDLEKVVLYEQFRKHLLPLIDDLRRDSGDQRPPRLKRIQAKTKIELALDIREIAAARGAGGKWAIVVGGKFPKHGVIEGLAEVLREEGIEARLEANPRRLIVPSGVSIGQAEDGSIIVASSQDWLEGALPVQETHARLGLSREAAASFSTLAEPLAELGRHPAALAIPALREATRIRRVTAELAPGEPLQGTARVELEPGVEPAAAVARVQSLLSGLERLLRLAGSDLAGEAAILGSAEVSPAGSDAVWVQFEWQHEQLDRGTRSLADQIRDRMAVTGKK
jgi:hypothetical protein